MTAAVIVSVVAGSVVAMERLAPSDSVPVEQPTEPPPAPEPISGGMWPQTSMEEVREAQRLADAGDPDYTWQVDAQMKALGGPLRRVGTSFENAEIVDRFLREELGWEEFIFNEFVGWEESFSNLTYIRCEPGGTNPLYPNDPWAGGCAPTIDELRYETVQIDLTQPVRRDPTGIWVVNGWAMTSPFSQVVPPTAEASALMEEFLQARIDGEGAEEYVEVLRDEHVPGGVPLLYATTTGAAYERFEFERVALEWPFGGMEFKVRMFAEGGDTVVEQLFSVDPEAGRLGVGYSDDTSDAAPTTENGQAEPVTYEFLDGAMTAAAAWPWEETWLNNWGLLVGGESEERLEVWGDPMPVATGCRQGHAPADAEALARSIRSDPDLEAAAPEAVSIGGIDALRIDVVLASDASVCGQMGTPLVLDGASLDHGSRMRLYLLDAPEGSSIRILAITVVAPEAGFSQVIEAATPVVESIEFRAR